MAEEILEIQVRIAGVDKAKQIMGELTGTTNKAGQSMTSSLLKANIATEAIMSTLRSLVTITQKAFSAVINFVGGSISQYQEYERALIGLGIISERFGVSENKARKAAIELGKELRIGPIAAAKSLENLLKSGLSLPQSVDLLRRFTNEAITGKSAHLSLSQAVENLSFAYTTNNSMLGNLSGVTENFSTIIQRGRKILIKQGVAQEKITEEMAKYAGMVDLTNLTLGSAKRFQGTWIDMTTQMSMKVQELRLAIGKALQPILNQLGRVLLPMVEAGVAKLIQVTERLRVGFGIWWQQNGPAITKAFASIIPHLQALWIQVSKLLTPTDAATKSFGKFGTNLAIGVANALKTVVGWLTQLFKWLQSKEGREAIKSLSNDIYTAFTIAKTVIGAVARAIEFVISKWNFFKIVFKTVLAMVMPGVNAFLNLRDGINKVSAVAAKVPPIFQRIKNAIQEVAKFVSNAYQWGKHLITNFVNGIKDGLGPLKSIVDKAAGLVKNVLGHSVPKMGPLAHDDKWGAHLVDNIINGMKQREASLAQQANRTASIASQGRGGIDNSRTVNIGNVNLATNRPVEGQQQNMFVNMLRQSAFRA